jgi:hypothetical protein
MQWDATQDESGITWYGNVARVPKAIWTRSGRRSPLANVADVRSPLARIGRVAPGVRAETLIIPEVLAIRPRISEQRAFYIAVRPCGDTWEIGRIPATPDRDLEKLAFAAASNLGWVIICDPHEDGYRPARFIRDLNLRQMKDEARRRHDTLVRILPPGNEDPVKVDTRLKQAIVLQVPDVLAHH